MASVHRTRAASRSKGGDGIAWSAAAKVRLLSAAGGPRPASLASSSATARTKRANASGATGADARKAATRALQRSPASAWDRQSARASPDSRPAAACSKGTNSQELWSPGSERGGPRRCQGGYAAAGCYGGPISLRRRDIPPNMPLGLRQLGYVHLRARHRAREGCARRGCGRGEGCGVAECVGLCVRH